jgi:hypothetical protein
MFDDYKYETSRDGGAKNTQTDPPSEKHAQHALHALHHALHDVKHQT